MSVKYVRRNCDNVIANYLRDKVSNKKVLLVEGARQVGKTSFVENAIEEYDGKSISINLEENRTLRSLIDGCRDFSSFEMLLLDRLGFDGAGDQLLFIDEAQESLKLGGFVRFMKEKWSRATVVLSGSTLTRLFRDDVRYPVGRVKRLVIRPFSFSEYLRAVGKDHLADYIHEGDPDVPIERHEYLLDLFDHYISTGGLPDVVMGGCRGENRDDIMRGIFADYESDFIRIFGEKR